ncbi:MAG: fibronectin-binding domain-containing protein [Clostridiales bacterium]|nr:fibronectin-binding domain-containing protein [Clostridiales bacterium]
MAMDGIALGAVISECQPLVGGKIDKVQQPEKDLLLFTVRANNGTVRLLVCTHPENGRMQLTGRSFDNPLNAPAFCMLLRRRLVGGRICSVHQLGTDRVCELIVLARNELFDEVALRLIVELTGKHANLLLLEPSGAIVDCLRRVSGSNDGARILLPGFPYEPIPPQNKLDPFLASVEDFASAYRSPDPARAITAAFDGVSRQSAAALVSAAPSADALHTLLQSMKRGSYAPCLAFNDAGEPAAALPFLPSGLYAHIEPMSGMSEALDRYYADRDQLVRIRRHGAALRHTVSTALSRAQNKYAAFLQTILSGDEHEAARISGELILANLHLAKPGQSELIVDDYFVNPPAKRAIPLDPAYSAQENARRYFKQYRKGKLGKAYAESQFDGLAGEIAYLEGQLENIDKCDTLYELDEIREELIRERYLRPEKAKASKPANKSSAPMRFLSSDGVSIYVGKNNRQNDALTLHSSRPENFWLHAKNIPGSHVIVDFEGEPPEATLREAASLAAYFSQARSSSGVPVDYAPRKFVKKPAGARPGMVIYTTNRTLYVTPDAALIKALRMDAEKR